jgi:hypothetical protein
MIKAGLILTGSLIGIVLLFQSMPKAEPALSGPARMAKAGTLMPESARAAGAQAAPKATLPSVGDFKVGDLVGIVRQVRVYRSYCPGPAAIAIILGPDWRITSLGRITEFAHKANTDEYFAKCTGNNVEYFLLDDLQHVTEDEVREKSAGLERVR